jgi:hypothetical protein
MNVVDGACHCNAVHWQFDGTPDSATVCNCTICRRYAVLWAYGYENEGIRVSGGTQIYIRGDSIEFHFCPNCGCVAYWRARRTDEDGRRRIAVNLRLAEPDAVARVPVDRIDGLGDFAHLPRDGRCVADYGF